LWVVLVILAGAILSFAPDLVKGILGVATGVSGVISAFLLKFGRVKPGSPWAGETFLGMLLLGIGVLGFGLEHLSAAFEEVAASESNPPVIMGLVLLIKFLGIPVGMVIEVRARKKRKSRSEARD
jgi:hypothetical protein